MGQVPWVAALNWGAAKAIMEHGRVGNLTTCPCCCASTHRLPAWSLPLLPLFQRVSLHDRCFCIKISLVSPKTSLLLYYRCLCCPCWAKPQVTPRQDPTSWSSISSASQEQGLTMNRETLRHHTACDCEQGVRWEEKGSKQRTPVNHSRLRLGLGPPILPTANAWPTQSKWDWLCLLARVAKEQVLLLISFLSAPLSPSLFVALLGLLPLLPTAFAAPSCHACFSPFCLLSLSLCGFVSLPGFLQPVLYGRSRFCHATTPPHCSDPCTAWAGAPFPGRTCWWSRGLVPLLLVFLPVVLASAWSLPSLLLFPLALSPSSFWRMIILAALLRGVFSCC